MKRWISLALAGAMVLSLTACSAPEEETAQEVDMVAELGLTAEAKDATEYTVEVNSAVLSQLDFADTSEYENATRGLIAALEITDDEGNVIWSQRAYSFLEDDEEAPGTVNPSLWENVKNNHAYGLFEVTEGIYQVRGYDMANLTLVAGDTGWIVFDTMMSAETAQAAMELVKEHLGDRPVKAVIISHSHVDHFGGIGGIVTAEELADVELVANNPESLNRYAASGRAAAASLPAHKIAQFFHNVFTSQPNQP